MNLKDNSHLQEIVASAPIGIAILNAATFEIEILNDKFIEISGKPKTALLNKWYWEPFAETRSFYEKAMLGVVESGDAFYTDELQFALSRHDREEWLYVTFVYAPVKDGTGAVTRLAVWVLENNTPAKARKASEAQKNNFQEERDHFQSIFMQAPAGICILGGPDLIYELVNPAYQSILPGRNLLGRPIFEALPELIGSPVQELLLKVYQTGELQEMREQLVPVAAYEGGPTTDRYFTFSFQARRDARNEIDGIVNIVFEVTSLIAAQQELQRSREQAEQQKRVYETIASGTPDLMYVWDLNYRFTYVNNALLQMWGKTWDDSVGKGLRDNGYEEWHAAMHEREIDQVRETKKAIRGEVSFPHATLGKRIYDYILIPVLDENGEVEAVAGTTRDVSERKQMEQALADSTEELQAINEEMAATNEEQAASNEELSATNFELAEVNLQLQIARLRIEEGELALRLAIEAANFGTWYLNSVSREFIANDRLKELFGYHPEESFTLEQALAQITDEYRDFVTNKIEEAIHQNGDYDVTYPVTGLHDRQLRWLRAIGNLKTDPSGEFSAFTGLVMDITEPYLAARKIERAEENLRMSIEAADSGTYSINTRTFEFFASPRLKELFGFRKDEDMPYEACMQQIREDFRPVAYQMVEAAVTKGERFELEYPVIGHHDGRQRWLRGIGTVQHDSNGRDSFFTGIINDITKQKEDEQRKNDFIGMVSHELKTPLTSLTAIIQVANLKLKNSEDSFLSGAMNKANTQVKRMSNMINGFLNVSRLESAKLMIDKKPFLLNSLIEEIIRDMVMIISTHTFQFEPCDPIVINADEEKIGSVITNLLSNAVKYSPGGKSVVISCKVIGYKVQVSVTDYGLGLTAESKNKVFDRYFRVENDYTQHISGFGIGLYLSAEIVRRHHGEIWADSEIGLGSTFNFSLPITSSNGS